MAQGSNNRSSEAGGTPPVKVRYVDELVAVESVDEVANDEALGERFVHDHAEPAAQLGERRSIEQAQPDFGVQRRSCMRVLMSSRTSMRRCWAASMTMHGELLEASHTRRSLYLGIVMAR